MAGSGPSATTVALTSGTDVLSANVFNAPIQVQTGQNNETLGGADQLTGTGTNPTLNAEVTGFTHTIAPSSLKGIETVNLTVSPLAPVAIGTAAGTVTLNAASADAVKNLSVNANNIGSAVAVTNLATKLDNLTITQNNGNVTVTNLAPALAGTTDSVNVKLDQVTAGTLTLNTSTGSNGYETVALTSQGTIANALTGLVATGATKVTVAGSQNLSITGALPNSVVNVDATTFTGQLDVLTGNGNVSVIGGTVNDTIRFAAGQFNVNDKVDGGTGTDTLRVAAAADVEAITTANSNIISVETLTVQDSGTAGATLRADLLGTSVNTINFLDGAAAGNYTVRLNAGTNTITVANVPGNATAGFGATGTVTIEANGTATNDALTLNLNGDDLNTAATETSQLTVGNLNLSSNGRAIESLTINTSNATAAGHNVGNIVLPSTVGVTDTITVAGTSTLNITGAVTADKIDASGLTGGASLVMALQTHTAPGGMLITGSAGNDTLVGTANGDSITDGAGDDRVVGGAGVDAISFSAGNDRVIFGETITSGSALSASNYDNVSGFTVGATAAAT